MACGPGPSLLPAAAAVLNTGCERQNIQNHRTNHRSSIVRYLYDFEVGLLNTGILKGFLQKVNIDLGSGIVKHRFRSEACISIDESDETYSDSNKYASSA